MSLFDEYADPGKTRARRSTAEIIRANQATSFRKGRHPTTDLALLDKGRCGTCSHHHVRGGHRCDKALIGGDMEMVDPFWRACAAWEPTTERNDSGS